jgi:hypothetical protein
MDEPVERGRMPGDPTPKVRFTNDLFRAEFEERRLSLMFIRHRNELVVSIRGNPITVTSMHLDSEIATALTRWLQARIAEM